MSKGCDQQLCLADKASYWFHYFLCFTCRRVNRQIRLIQAEAPKLCACNKLKNSCLSDEAKTRIKDKVGMESL